MRLIDADKITSGKIAKYLGRGYECCTPDIEDMLKEQPTAYDVDKVVKQLEVLSDRADYDMSVCEKGMYQYYDGSFSLVVFDPPHLRYAGETGWLVKKYGKLDEHWPEMLHDGFQECMRVLKEDGVLIFKWAETDISAQKVWKAIGQKPLFGHHSGKRSGTFWGCYMKGQE